MNMCCFFVGFERKLSLHIFSEFYLPGLWYIFLMPGVDLDSPLPGSCQKSVSAVVPCHFRRDPDDSTPIIDFLGKMSTRDRNIDLLWRHVFQGIPFKNRR